MKNYTAVEWFSNILALKIELHAVIGMTFWNTYRSISYFLNSSTEG